MLTRPWNIHAEQLFPLGYGHSLWYAQPDLDTGREVLVGDIRYFSQRHLRPLFNTTRPADDLLNQGNVPDDFRQLVLPEDVHINRTNILTQPILASRGITFEEEPNTPPDSAAGWKFRSRGDAGAFVVLDPPGVADAIDSDVRARPAIIDYMRENLDSWRAHAHSRKMALADQDVLFVCGTVKTARWGTAAFRGRRFRGAEGYVSGELARVGSTGAFRVDHVPGSHVGTGPLLAETADAPALGASQCLFVHYYKMKRVACGDTTLGGHQHHLAHCVIERYPVPNEPGYDPVNCLLDYILEQSGAPIAAASDTDVTDLFSGRTFPEWDKLPRAIRRAAPPIEIDEHGVGTISVAHASVH